MIPRRLGEAVHDRETEARGIRALANDGIDGVAIEIEKTGEEVVREALFILPMSPDENRKSLGRRRAVSSLTKNPYFLSVFSAKEKISSATFPASPVYTVSGAEGA